jgi:hypothetical protein
VPKLPKFLQPVACTDCEKLYGDPYFVEDNPSHWHCGSCGEVCGGHQGHYRLLAAGWGFSCQQEQEAE